MFHDCSYLTNYLITEEMVTEEAYPAITQIDDLDTFADGLVSQG